MSSHSYKTSLLAGMLVFTFALLPETSAAGLIIPAFADSTTAVYLKDGRTIYGTIISQNDEVIRVENASGVAEFPRSFVKSIERVVAVQKEESKLPASAPGATLSGSTDFRYPTAKGSLLFDIQLVYSSISPDKGDALTNVSFVMNASTFVVRGVGVGLDIGYTSIAGIGIGKSTSTVSAFLIGPKVMLALGSEKSSVFPYMHLAYNHLTATVEPKRGISRSEGANSVKVGLGFLFKRFGHVGTPLEFGAEFQSFDKTTITVYSIGIGISGFLYGLF